MFCKTKPSWQGRPAARLPLHPTSARLWDYFAQGCGVSGSFNGGFTPPAGLRRSLTFVGSLPLQPLPFSLVDHLNSSRATRHVLALCE